MKALFELFRRFDARRIFGFIRRLGGMSRPKVKCYDLRSTHALRVEGDLCSCCCLYPVTNFYPRPPGGGRHERHINGAKARGHFYPRPPGGGRPNACSGCSITVIFLSTPSGWRATGLVVLVILSNPISIHALRVEGDPAPPFGGGRRKVFLSTPSGWRATSTLFTIFCTL